ncbi:hypothetical protein [Streptosporangium sp. NPDC002607]
MDFRARSRVASTAGCRVLGVEPDARMADFARRGGFEVEVATTLVVTAARTGAA